MSHAHKKQEDTMSLDWLNNGSIWMEFLDRDGSSEISAPFGSVRLRGARMEDGADGESRPLAAFEGGYWMRQGEEQGYSRVVAFGVFSLHMEMQGGWEISLDCVNVGLSGHVLQVDGRAIALLNQGTSLWTRHADGVPLTAIRLEPENRVSRAADDFIGTTRRAWPVKERAGLLDCEDRALAA